MNGALFNRRLRQLHLWLGVAIGAQVGLWLVSGLFMTWFPIETVRGEHLVNRQTVDPLDWSEDYLSVQDAIEAAGLDTEAITAPAPATATATRLGGMPVWQISGPAGSAMVDARSGDIVTPLSRDLAAYLANTAYAGTGTLTSGGLLNDPPREYGRAGPVWRMEFGPPDAATLYVDAMTGEVRAVRTGLWRAFDFMWGLHIMDWSSRENFNSWWIKMTASLAVLFFLAGLGLVILRLGAIVRRKRNS